MDLREQIEEVRGLREHLSKNRSSVFSGGKFQLGLRNAIFDDPRNHNEPPPDSIYFVPLPPNAEALTDALLDTQYCSYQEQSVLEELEVGARCDGYEEVLECLKLLGSTSDQTLESGSDYRFRPSHASPTFAELSMDKFKFIGQTVWPVARHEPFLVLKLPRDQEAGWALVGINRHQCLTKSLMTEDGSTIVPERGVKEEVRTVALEAFSAAAIHKDLNALGVLYPKAKEAAFKLNRLTELAVALGHYVFAPEAPILNAHPAGAQDQVFYAVECGELYELVGNKNGAIRAYRAATRAAQQGPVAIGVASHAWVCLGLALKRAEQYEMGIRAYMWGLAAGGSDEVIFTIVTNMASLYEHMCSWDRQKVRQKDLKSVQRMKKNTQKQSTPKAHVTQLLACDACGATKLSQDLLACAGCKVTKYCDRSCQKHGWKRHKEECKNLAAGTRVQPEGPEPNWDLGSIVELHSLSKEELNGKLGAVIGAFNKKKGRYDIEILGASSGSKKVSVKPVNLQAPSSITKENTQRAEGLAVAASNKMRDIRLGRTPKSALDEAAAQLYEAVALNPLLWQGHDLLGDNFFMAEDFKSATVHFRRAVANGGPVESRIRLAGALGSGGDAAGEAQQLEAVLAADPDHQVAKVNLAGSYRQQGRAAEALELLTAVLGSRRLPGLCRGQPQLPGQLAQLAVGAAMELARRAGEAPEGGGDFTGPAGEYLPAAPARRAELRLAAKALRLLQTRLDGGFQAAANLALVLSQLGDFDEAEAAARGVLAPRGGAAAAGAGGGPLPAQARAFLLHTLGRCAEARADALLGRCAVEEEGAGAAQREAGAAAAGPTGEAGGGGDLPAAAAELYAAAKARYRESHAAAADPAAALGFVRAQAKAAPARWRLRQPPAPAQLFVEAVGGGGRQQLEVLDGGAGVVGTAEVEEGHMLLPGYG